MFDSPASNQAVGDALDYRPGAFDDDHFDAIVLIQMHVRIATDISGVFVLYVGEVVFNV